MKHQRRIIVLNDTDLLSYCVGCEWSYQTPDSGDFDADDEWNHHLLRTFIDRFADAAGEDFGPLVDKITTTREGG